MLLSTAQAQNNNVTTNSLNTPVPFNVDGFHAINRTSSTNVELFTDTTQYSATSQSGTIASQNQVLLRTLNNTSSSRMRMYAMGSSLVSENAAFYNALDNYFSKIGWSGRRTSTLDIFPNAQAAYSLRALNSQYTGALIRIRRSSDDAEMNVYATQEGDLNTDEIRRFVGSVNAFVVIWYDQSGNNRHLSQSVKERQPQIVINGSINMDGRRVAVLHTSASQNLLLQSPLNLGTTYSFFGVASFSATGKSLIGDSTSVSYALNVGASTITHSASNVSASAASTYDISYSLFSQFRNNTTTVNTFRNNTQLSPITLASNSSFIFSCLQGEQNASTSFLGSISEIIIYATNQSSLASSIRENINDYYKIFIDAQPLLLNQYPGAAAAYSLRLLNSAYTGNCIEVRKASDNTTSNIGFVGGVLDTAALKTFCASTNCFVRTWYDQSGNGRNAVQTATTTRQPTIVTGGVVNRGINNLPTVFFDGGDIITTSSFTSDSPPFTMFLVNRYSSITGARYITSMPTDSGVMGYISGSSTQNEMYNGTYLYYTPLTLTAGVNYLWYSLFNSTSSEFQINNSSLVTGNSGNSSATILNIGGRSNNSAFYNGQIGELIYYPDNQSANQTGIRSNINNYYTIY